MATPQERPLSARSAEPQERVWIGIPTNLDRWRQIQILGGPLCRPDRYPALRLLEEVERRAASEGGIFRRF